MTPYPAYKPTGLPWLPQIPEYWEIKKLRTLLSVVSEKGHPDAPLLSVVRERGVIIRNTEDNSENHNYIPDELTNYKYVRKGQFAMNKMKAWQGSYGISNFDGIVSPAYFVFNLKEVTKNFFNLAIRSKFYVPYFGQASDGIRVGQWDLSIPRMKEIPFAVPPPDEQAQIVRYLDSMTAKINKLIRAKKKQIALLQEHKQAIINQAVTKGLNPNAEMKDSGIDWLGKIPKHWTCCRCKYLFKEINIRSETGEEEHLSMSQKLGLIPDSQLDGHHLMSESYIGGKICEENDLVLNRLKAHLGVFAIAPQRGVVSPDYTILHINSSKILPRFAEAILTSSSCRSELRVRVRGIVEGFWRLYTDDFYGITLPLPDVDEQQQILHFIDKMGAELDKCKNAYTSDIFILNEFKDRLISSIVTGQVDICDIPVGDFDPADLVSEAPDDIEENTNIYIKE